MRKLSHKYYVTLIIIGLTLLGCQQTSITCPEDQVPYLRCLFTNNSEADIDSITIVLTTIDSIIYDAEAPSSKIDIPLQLSADSTLFHVIFSNDSSDYFLVKHQPNVTFESPECGFLIDFTLDSNSLSTSLNVDSIYLLNPIIDYNGYDNLQIFY